MWRPSQRLVRFSLRAFLVVATLVACWFGWHAARVRAQQRAVAVVMRLGGNVGYDYERMAQEERRKNPPPQAAGAVPAADARETRPDDRPPAPAWLVALTGPDWWGTVETVHLHACTLTSADAAAIARLPALRQVSLRECEVRGADLAPWAHLQSLIGVFFYDCELDDAQLAFAAALPRLEYAEFSRSTVGNAALAHLSSRPLRKLRLD